MRSHRLWRALSERRGEGYVDVIVLVLCAVMVLALAMRVLRFLFRNSSWIPLLQNWCVKQR